MCRSARTTPSACSCCVVAEGLPYGLILRRRYNKLVGVVKKLVTKISALDPKDPFRKEITESLLQKL